MDDSIYLVVQHKHGHPKEFYKNIVDVYKVPKSTLYGCYNSQHAATIPCHPYQAGRGVDSQSQKTMQVNGPL